MKRSAVYIGLLLLLFETVFGQIVINEICSFNAISAYDENMETPDWIELYNKGTEPINLKGYRIYDKNEFDNAWMLPDTIIEPGEYLIIFCDEQNKYYEGNFVIEASGHGTASHNATDGMRFIYLPVTGNFDIYLTLKGIRNSEKNTRLGIMFRESLEEDSRYVSILTENRENNEIRVHCRETKRENPLVKYYWNKVIDFVDDKFRINKVGDTLHTYIWDGGYYWYRKETSFYLPTNNNSGFAGICFSSGNNLLLSNAVVSDLFLNNNKIDFNDLNVYEVNSSIQGKSYYSKELHSNFKLAREGETIFLWDPDGTVVNQLGYKYLNSDNSFGRYPSGTENIEYFKFPTPFANNDKGYKGILPTPEINIQHGFYNEPVSVSISCSDENAKIFYSLNGDNPDKESMIWNGTPIEINTTTTLRAIAMSNEYIDSEIMNESIFINDTTTLDIISFFTDPDNLYDKEKGIFQEKNLNSDIMCYGYFQLWGNDKSFKYASPCGYKLNGQTSRKFSQKSIRVYANDESNASEFNYPFFGDNGLDKYERLVFRNGGTDWTKTIFRDGFAATLSKQISSLDAMDFSPAVMFLNGKFYGIQNIRERIDETYLSIKHSIPDKSINILEDWERLKTGSCAKFKLMRDSIINMNMSEINAYKFLERNIDIENLVDFVIFESFLANIDWPWKNMKFWQSDSFDGKWRWILNDMDYICGVGSFPDYNMFTLMNDEQYEFNQWFNKVLENETFRNKLLNRNADLVNTVLLSSNTIKLVDSISAIFAPEIPRQHAKYDSSAKEWQEWVNTLKDFLNRRPKPYLNHWVERFNLTDTVSVDLFVNPVNSGKIRISTITPVNYPWGGTYYKDVPITIMAIPNKGYSFKDWSNPKYSGSSITIYLQDEFFLTANFVKNSELDSTVIINEIMYKNHESYDSDDWFELYNAGNTTINLFDWYVKDNDDLHKFIFPKNLVIKQDEYLVVCKDTAEFKLKYPEVTKITGNFDFGISEKDMVRLYEPSEYIHDSVSYSNKIPWPTATEGTGFSIELIDSEINNDSGSNWKSSLLLFGTPGKMNSVSVDSSEPINEARDISVFPNPFSNYAVIDINSNDCNLIDIFLYNSVGQIVFSKLNQSISKGNNRLPFELKYLSNGSYYFEVSYKNNAAKKFLHIIKYKD